MTFTPTTLSTRALKLQLEKDDTYHLHPLMRQICEEQGFCWSVDGGRPTLDRITFRRLKDEAEEERLCKELAVLKTRGVTTWQSKARQRRMLRIKASNPRMGREIDVRLHAKEGVWKSSHLTLPLSPLSPSPLQ